MLDKGSLLAKLKRYDEALGCYDVAIEIAGPEVVGAFYDKAALLNQLGRYEEALGNYNMVNQLEPSFAEAWHEKSHVLEKLGRNDEAQECLEEYKEIAKNPKGCCGR